MAVADRQQASAARFAALTGGREERWRREVSAEHGQPDKGRLARRASGGAPDRRANSVQPPVHDL